MTRNVRILFAKIGKSYDILHFETAQHLQQINAFQSKINDFRTRKVKKLPIDSNEQFASMQTIMKAQKRQNALQEEWNRKDRAAEARKLANEVASRTIESMTIVWQVEE